MFTHTHSKFLLIVAPVVILLTSCEQAVESVDIPYVERIVVRGVVETGRPIDSIWLSKTLPINEEYTAEKAALTDASVSVQTSTGATILQHRGSGYYGNPELFAKAGESYTLNVKWHDRHVRATTVAPFPVSIDSMVLAPITTREYPDTSLQVVFTPRGNQVYAITFRQPSMRTYPDGTSGDGDYFENGLYTSERIARRRDTSEDGHIRLRTSWFPSGSWTGNDTLFALLYTFDPQFYDYYQTYTNGNDFDGPFSTGGETVAWNVSGDGIGMFIGRARSERRVRP